VRADRRFEVVAGHEVSFGPTGLDGGKGGPRLGEASQGPPTSTPTKNCRHRHPRRSTPHNAGFGTIAHVSGLPTDEEGDLPTAQV
jgi:hypothetical protein